MAGLETGRLDRRIAIERATTTTDDLGADVAAWQPIRTVWAERLTQRATEAWKAGGTAAQREVVWRIRWAPDLADLSERERVVYAGQVYPISGVVEFGRREGLEITTNPSGEQA
ncbi:phage head closure protein [Sphingomonas sp. HHU CXW]|uniref:Phage head closure protein n=1 Tax=Sphingomonas hominis TaxID=2741495 RepID=A0ABX2JCX9_9SPHN|nr:phage head closure protein [Sphingomonas hominis]NTS64160.1 phage head closure protein [Sphingomonas hominis]